ncbi:hypothetical protein [Pedobacter sp. BMA]|uniref:hypothetical protein n=1 Tax=Pedobacter sp. BMA TaxID=1663685 RepID=UPI0012E03D2B|nr:hypothetical protein [Pedobacter sp. BMA]
MVTDSKRIMITTSFLFMLIAFEICYLTSKQFKQQHPPSYVSTIVHKKKQFRVLAALFFIVSSTLLILNLGWGSGIAAIVFTLMAAGSLIVSIQPFRYVKIGVIAAVYFSILLLEIFI